MTSVTETTAAVPASSSAFGRGLIVGGYVVAAGLMMTALIVLGLLLSLLLSAGSRAVALDRSPSAQAAALASWQAAAKPDMSSCIGDMSAVQADLAAIGSDPLTSGSLGADAQQMHADCQSLGDQIAQVNVGSNALAQDAQHELHSALDDVLQGGGRALDAAQDIDGGSYQAAVGALKDANNSFTSGTQHIHAVGADLGVDVG